MKAVVTGGAGFIGSHLVERLLADGAEVTVVDSFTRGRERNLASVAADTRLRVVRADVRDAAALRPAFEGAQQVYHLAALADIVPSISDPMEYFTTNVDGTVNVLEASRAAGAGRFVYVASSTCYGIPDHYPTPETAPVRTEYPYALTKHLGELCALHWGRVYGLPVVSLRFFNVYGPRSRTGGTYGAVMGVFLAQKLNRRPLTIVGDGTQTRDFTYVTDVVDAMVTAARSEVRDEVFNVGSGGTYSVNELADRIGGERVHVPKRPGEPDCTYADISKIRSRLGWEPKVSFGEGVARLVERIGDWSEAPVWTPDSIREATADWFKYLSR
ncbi:MAG: UDP-glucose 4-epimerase [Candidatus Omnitrophica bacterium]|nr:UDP-glucose 4-epimerase [Candidatus Omnitrophota bacterium]